MLEVRVTMGWNGIFMGTGFYDLIAGCTWEIILFFKNGT